MTHIDYEPARNCENPDSYGMICVKCGKCGRKFSGGLLLPEKAKKRAKGKNGKGIV